MTEKEKMLRGELYDPLDEELLNDRKKAKELCREFNLIETDKTYRKKEILKELFGKEYNCFIEPNFFCDYGYNITLGQNFYANHNCIILDVNKVTIGDNVMLGPNVQLYTATHPLTYEKRNAGRELGLPITIGDNVWIGGGTIINPDVTIGENAVIGAGSVVTKDIPADVFAAGNPCKVIKTIDNERGSIDET
jgi:maltose O-acetyltransferase